MISDMSKFEKLASLESPFFKIVAKEQWLPGYLLCAVKEWLVDPVRLDVLRFFAHFARYDRRRGNALFLPCGHLDFESAVTKQNDEFKGSFDISSSRLLNVKTWPRNSYFFSRMIGGIVTRDPVRSGRYQPIMPAHSQSPPSGEQTSKWSVFLQFLDEEIRKLVGIVVPESTKKSTCFASCFVLFSRRCFRCERKYLKDNKDNKLLLAPEICTDSCPWILSVP